MAGEGEATERAFAGLVERHGPMVLRVCRGALRDAHAAEDAFQATFLILARRAGSIRAPDSLASWIQGVAWHVAATARAAAARRRAHERAAGQSRPQTSAGGGGDDLAAVLHEELGRLPDRYRTAVVLCCLQGLTQREAAEQVGWPLGTLQSRLARGRDRLRARLTRRGIAPTSALAAVDFTFRGTQAAIPATLARSTARLALAWGASGPWASGVVPVAVQVLVRSGVRGMFWSQLKPAA